MGGDVLVEGGPSQIAGSGIGCRGNNIDAALRHDVPKERRSSRDYLNGSFSLSSKVMLISTLKKSKLESKLMNLIQKSTIIVFESKRERNRRSVEEKDVNISVNTIVI